MSQSMRTTHSKLTVDSTSALTSKSGGMGSKAAHGRVDGMSAGSNTRVGSETARSPTLAAAMNQFRWWHGPEYACEQQQRGGDERECLKATVGKRKVGGQFASKVKVERKSGGFPPRRRQQSRRGASDVGLNPKRNGSVQKFRSHDDLSSLPFIRRSHQFSFNESHVTGIEDLVEDVGRWDEIKGQIRLSLR